MRRKDGFECLHLPVCRKVKRFEICATTGGEEKDRQFQFAPYQNHSTVILRQGDVSHGQNHFSIKF